MQIVTHCVSLTTNFDLLLYYEEVNCNMDVLFLSGWITYSFARAFIAEDVVIKKKFSYVKMRKKLIHEYLQSPAFKSIAKLRALFYIFLKRTACFSSNFC